MVHVVSTMINQNTIYTHAAEHFRLMEYNVSSENV